MYCAALPTQSIVNLLDDWDERNYYWTPLHAVDYCESSAKHNICTSSSLKKACRSTATATTLSHPSRISRYDNQQQIHHSDRSYSNELQLLLEKHQQMLEQKSQVPVVDVVQVFNRSYTDTMTTSKQNTPRLYVWVPNDRKRSAARNDPTVSSTATGRLPIKDLTNQVPLIDQKPHSSRKPLKPNRGLERGHTQEDTWIKERLSLEKENGLESHNTSRLRLMEREGSFYEQRLLELYRNIRVSGITSNPQQMVEQQPHKTPTVRSAVLRAKTLTLDLPETSSSSTSCASYKPRQTTSYTGGRQGSLWPRS